MRTSTLLFRPPTGGAVAAVLSALAALLLLVVAPARAQPGGSAASAASAPVDVGALRAARRAAAARFLDRTAPQASRLEAADALGFPDDELAVALMRVATDRNESDAIRLAALQRHRYDGSYVEAVLRILADDGDGGELLDAGLVADFSRRTTRRPPPQTQQTMQITLRKLLADPRPAVRLNAYRALVADHDSAALESLTAALRRGTDLPIPAVEAVALLDLDGPARHIATLRPYLGHADPAVVASVARSLAIDEESRPRIVALASERRATSEVRIAALRGLARADPQFSRYAIPVMEDLRNDASVRAAAMSDLAGRLNYGRPEPAEVRRFATALQRMQTAPQALGQGRLASEAARVMEYLRRAHPEVLP